MDVPNELAYKMASSKRGQIVARHNLSKNADGTASGIGEGQIIEFSIPSSSNGVLASNETYFSMNLAAVSGEIRLGRGGVAGLISRVEILTDQGVLLETLQQYGALHRVVNLTHFSDQYIRDHASGVEGVLPVEQHLYASLATDSKTDAAAFNRVGIDWEAKSEESKFPANAADTFGPVTRVRRATEGKHYDGQFLIDTTPREFYFQLLGSGVFNSSTFFPLFAAGLRVRFILQTAAVALQTGTSYNVSVPKIYYTRLTMSDQLAASMQEALRNKKIYFAYNTFAHRSQNLPANTGALSVELTQPFTRTKGVFAVKRLVSELASGSDSFKFSPANFVNYQFKHDDTFIPNEQVGSVKRAYIELKKANGQLGAHLANFLPYSIYESSEGGAFVVGCNLENLHSDPMSGVSTTGSKTITLNVQLDGSGAAQQMDIWTYYVRVMVIEGMEKRVTVKE